MGQGPSGFGGPGGRPPGAPGGQNPNDKKDAKDKEPRKKAPPPRSTTIGRKKKKRGPESSAKLPEVRPHTRCKLRLLKMERIKDYLLMEEEFIQNQERLKPTEEKKLKKSALKLMILEDRQWVLEILKKLLTIIMQLFLPQWALNIMLL